MAFPSTQPRTVTWLFSWQLLILTFSHWSQFILTFSYCIPTVTHSSGNDMPQCWAYNLNSLDFSNTWKTIWTETTHELKIIVSYHKWAISNCLTFYLILLVNDWGNWCPLIHQHSKCQSKVWLFQTWHVLKWDQCTIEYRSVG